MGQVRAIPPELFTNNTSEKGLGRSDCTGHSYEQDDRQGLRRRRIRFVSRKKWELEGGVMHINTLGTAS